MRICPNCKHVDPPEWRQVPWKFDVDGCHSEDFAKMHPDLHEKLLKGHKVVCDENFAYQFSGKSRKFVWRVWKKMYEWGGKSAFNVPMESVIHKKDPFLKKISDF